MESFIHQTKTNQQELNKDSFYTTINNYDFIDKDNNPRLNEESDKRIMAKIKVKNTGASKHLIRLDNLKKIYDPTLDMSENKPDSLFNDSKNIQFKEVSKKTFDLYLSFLRTMNPSWIRNAEREDF